MHFRFAKTLNGFRDHSSDHRLVILLFITQRSSGKRYWVMKSFMNHSLLREYQMKINVNKTKTMVMTKAKKNSSSEVGSK